MNRREALASLLTLPAACLAAPAVSGKASVQAVFPCLTGGAAVGWVGTMQRQRIRDEWHRHFTGEHVTWAIDLSDLATEVAPVKDA